MNVLLLQMAHDEEVEDLGDLDSTLPDSMLPEASGVELAPPSDAGKGPSTTPAPTALTGASEDPAPAPTPMGEDASKAMGEPAAERPRGGGRAFAGGGIGFRDFKCKLLSL
jgi:hypothetical protein